jgi:hypothetical protein
VTEFEELVEQIAVNLLRADVTVIDSAAPLVWEALRIDVRRWYRMRARQVAWGLGDPGGAPPSYDPQEEGE